VVSHDRIKLRSDRVIAAIDRCAVIGLLLRHYMYQHAVAKQKALADVLDEVRRSLCKPICCLECGDMQTCEWRLPRRDRCKRILGNLSIRYTVPFKCDKCGYRGRLGMYCRGPAIDSLFG
jgi:hypothetical protein